MDSWERFDETSMTDKEAFYSSLNMENITDVGYTHPNRVFKTFKLKNHGEYHNLYVQSDTWAMSQKLPVDRFELEENISKFNEHFIKNYNEDGDIGYFFEVDIEYPKNFQHSDLTFLPERMKLNKCSKLVCNLYDKNKYAVHVRSLKQALEHGLKLKNVHKAITFYQ